MIKLERNLVVPFVITVDRKRRGGTFVNLGAVVQTDKGFRVLHGRSYTRLLAAVREVVSASRNQLLSRSQL